MNTKIFARKCPLCGFESGLILHHMQFTLESGNPLPAEYDVVSCNMCGFVYGDVDSSQEKYDEYYRDYSKYIDKNTASGYGDKEFDQRRVRATAELIAAHMHSADCSVLDIGSGGGGVLKALNDMGFSDLNALEPAAGCVDNMPEYIEAFVGSIFDDLRLLFGGKTFDFIILSHVFEHIYNIKQAILNVRQLMGENGILYIEVPDGKRYGDYYYVPFYYFDIEHINHFDECSLRNLGQMAGLMETDVVIKSIEVSETGFYPAVGMCFKKCDMLSRYVLGYIEQSKTDSRQNKLYDLLVSGDDIVIWGAGSYTKRLLSSLGTEKDRISFFVDSDVQKQGNYLLGLEIYSPEKLYDYKGIIVLCSALFADEIKIQITSMGIDNEVVVI